MQELIISFFIERSPGAVIIDVITLGGWLVLFFLLGFAFIKLYVDRRADHVTKSWQWILLAIDIPQQNIQTPKAVEQMFAHLAGAYDPPGLLGLFWKGHEQRRFSFEIISIEGYIQFLIWTEEALRDLVEAALYAQYPQAEITEVEDYVHSIPNHFPNPDYDLWAGDFGLAEDDAYPIRSYVEFEHSIAEDTVLKDPMGTFLESFTRIGPGEQMWFQILVEPIGSGWKAKAIKTIKKIIGAKPESHGGSKIADFISNAAMKTIEGIGDQIFSREAGESAHEQPDKENRIQYLTPGEKKIVEAMEDKIAKLGFKTKIRGLYIARKEVFRPTRGVNALIGAINQFNIPTENSIVPKVTTKANTKAESNRKKRLLLSAYKKRKIKRGGNSFVLNIEELASIWHFPMSHVATPMVQKAALKTVEPPPGLPLESSIPPPVESAQAIPVSKRPRYVTDSGEFGYEDDEKFG